MLKPNLVYVTYIAAPVERVWEALTSSVFTTRYFFGRSIEGDFAAGSEWILRMPDGRVDVRGRVLESDPPRKLHLTWAVEWLPEFKDFPESQVIWELESAGETTRLSLTELADDSIPAQFLEGGRKGWPVILSGLKTLLETGEPLKVPTPGPPA